MWRTDEPVALPSKAFDCMVYLVEHRERAVGRDELIAAVWGSVDTSDSVLGQTILHARKALGDTGKEQVAIRTVPRFGYQWVMPLVESADAIVAPAAVAEPANESHAAAAKPRFLPGRPRSWRALVAIIAVIVAFAGYLGWLAMQRPRSGREAAIQRGSPALVLPATLTSTGDEPTGWVRLGVMDLIAERLRATGMPVVPSDNVVALVHNDGTAPDVAALVRQAHVGLVVAPAVEQIGARWRVRIQTPFGRAPPVNVSAEGDDALDAATQASHRLAFALGLAATRDAAPTADRAQQMLVKQLDAALLAGKVAEAAGLVDAATPSLRKSPQVQLRIARLALQTGKLDLAQSLFADIVNQSSADSGSTVRARALTGLGAIALKRNDFQRAFDSFDGAVRLLSDENAPWLGNALTGRAASLAAQRKYEPAMADFARARVALEATGDGLALAVLDTNLASLASSRDDLHEAAQAFARVAQRFRDYSAPGFELDARINALQVNLLLLDLRAAREDDERISILAAAEPDPGRRLRAALAHYELLLQSGAFAEADALLARSRTDAVEVADAELLRDVDVLDGERALMRGHAGDALRLAERVHARADNPNDPRGKARALLLLVRAHIASNNVDAAQRAQRAMVEWAARDDLPVARIYAALAAAPIATQRGDAAEATRQLDAALTAAEAERVPYDIVRVVTVGIDDAIGAGDSSRIAALVQRASPWSAQCYDAAIAEMRAFKALGWNAALEDARVRAEQLPGASQQQQ